MKSHTKLPGHATGHPGAISRTSRSPTVLRHYLGGKWVHGQGHSLILDAPDGAPLYSVPEASQDELETAVGNAVDTFRTWRRSSISERAAILSRAASRLRDGADELAVQLVRETGRTILQARREVEGAAKTLDQYARTDLARRTAVLDRSSARVWGFELAEPLGVAALITPWNMPVQIAVHKIGAAIAAGCTAVLKPSPLAADSAAFIADALQSAGLPGGALGVLHGSADVGSMLAGHRSVAVVSFTGSDQAGRAVMSMASRGPRKVLLELGGKSANIVFADAPMNGLIDGLLHGFIRNQGAVCTAASRIYIQESIFDDITLALRDAVLRTRVGDPYVSGGADIGAVRTAEICRVMDRALAEAGGIPNAAIHGGGPVRVAGRSGYYRRPALITMQGATDCNATRNELMAPVAVAIPFRDEQEVIEAANDSPYGLAVGIWTQSLARAERIWSSVDVGTVYVNSYHRMDSIPLASQGRKASGFGAEGGERGVAEFTTTKSIHILRLPDSL